MKLSPLTTSLLFGWILSACNSHPQQKAIEGEDNGSRMQERQHMIATQLTNPGRDIKNPRVIEAMRTVPRHRFVLPQYSQQAYADHPLPIGYNQTISQPYIVAFMTEQLDPQPEEKILEIGTGSGYQAAILSGLCAEVYSIEIIPELAEQASALLKELDYDNVHVKYGNGYKGWPEYAPFDGIIVTCAPEDIPQALVDQLKEGGRMIIPVGNSMNQQLFLLKKHDNRMEQTAVLPVRFVPMTGRTEGR